MNTPPLKQFLDAIRAYLRLARMHGPDALGTPTFDSLRMTMTNETMTRVAGSGVDVDRDFVFLLVTSSLVEVARRHANGVTLGRVRDEPLLLAETITDPCRRGHIVRECPKRRLK
jgi:hypothetical protein